MTINNQVIAWLGQWRDHLPNEAVRALQDIVECDICNDFADKPKYRMCEKHRKEYQEWIKREREE